MHSSLHTLQSRGLSWQYFFCLLFSSVEKWPVLRTEYIPLVIYDDVSGFVLGEIAGKSFLYAR